MFLVKNYNVDFVRRNTHSNTDSNTQTSVNSGLVTIRLRLSGTVHYTVHCCLFVIVLQDQCCDSQATYISETGRSLSTRLTEHKRAKRNGDVNNHFAKHHLQTKHQIDWDSATCITYSTDYYERLTLESCFTNLEQTPLNRSQKLPAPCKRLIDGIKQNARTTGQLKISLITNDCLIVT